jgi:hypothetical protein|tara:strand:+ start:456 stop:563 length:108 start_codon:yes stop_codon:yes gene_type:complete
MGNSINNSPNQPHNGNAPMGGQHEGGSIELAEMEF